ncbi:MAG: response regulator [Polyangiaceae bacterium]
MTTTLLGVDDSKTMRKVIEITFGGEDFKTVLAENADDAMSKLGAERPSIVLVDAALEGTNGYELCQRIKAASPAVGVLLLASKQQPYDRNRGTQVGADDFVDKPFDTQQLIDKVSALARKLAGGAQSHPLATTQQGVAPAPPTAVVSARSASLDVAARPRSPTLAYGNVNPMMPQAGPGPVAPMIPAPSAPRSSPVASPAPAAAAPPPVRPAPVPAYVAPAPPPAPTPAPPPVAAAPVAAATAAATNGADFAGKLGDLGLTRDQITAVLALSREVVEKVVWEVVPTLAETMIKEEIKRLTAE